MAKKWDDASNFVMRKMHRGEHRLVHKQILRWRKKAKKLGDLALSQDIKSERKGDIKKSFFTFDEDEDT